MFSVASIRAIRYCDIVASSDGPRTSIITRVACRAKFSAAWPAELAAPTRKTSSPAVCAASTAVAP